MGLESDRKVGGTVKGFMSSKKMGNHGHDKDYQSYVKREQTNLFRTMEVPR